MSGWEKKIINAFIDHYFASVSETGEDRKVLRIRSSVFFPDFDTVNPDEKEAYLEAAESLERREIVKLNWEKRRTGERLKTLNCDNFERLFEAAGRPYPKTEAENIRVMLAAKLAAVRKNQAAENVTAILEFLAVHFGPREIGQGLDRRAMEEFIRLLEYSREPAYLENITARALSILLYRDSKRLENLMSLCKPLFTRCEKTLPFPDFAIPERSYPETMISGKIIIKYKNIDTPMINAGGYILNLPLETAREIEIIKTETTNKTVLTIENKETFYALGSPQKSSAGKNLSGFGCFLYTGGYPGGAASTLIKTLAASGFSFYHAGDLDPDGILILQYVQDMAEKPVIPLRMDAATFDLYRSWARPLSKTMLRQIAKVRVATRAIRGLDDLLRRIEETGMGVEQEIVDYR